MNPTASGTPARSAMAGIVRALVLRPDLWWAALGALRRMAAPGWWRTRPYLPVPEGLPLGEGTLRLARAILPGGLDFDRCHLADDVTQRRSLHARRA